MTCIILMEDVNNRLNWKCGHMENPHVGSIVYCTICKFSVNQTLLYNKNFITRKNKKVFPGEIGIGVRETW